VADGIADALTLAEDEQERRMRMMRGRLADYDVYRWAGDLLDDAAAVRRPPQKYSTDSMAAASGNW
jgi:trehalose 6-phosphate synthase